MSLREHLSGASDPSALARAAGVDLPSPAIGTALRALYAAPQRPGDLDAWRRISTQPWPKTRPRRAAAAIGRRGLKTTGLLAWACLHEVLRPAHDAHAAAGSRVYGVIVAPYVVQARESVRAVRSVLDQLAGIGVTYAVRDASGAPEVVITGPRYATERVVQVMTADAVSVRGFAICFAGFDEAGFLPFGETHAVRDRDIVRAISPAMVQFPSAVSLFVSSPGAPGSLFHGLVEKPPPGTVVVRAPTWVTNPRITEAACLAEAGGDLAAFEQEFAARRFGYAGETYIDTRALVVGSAHADQGPRPGSFVVGLDAGQIADSTAIVVCSGFDVEVAAEHAPVRHVVVEHAETIASSRSAPTPLEAIVGRAAALSRAYGDAPVLFDLFQGPTMKAAFARLGFREFVDPSGAGMPPARSFMQCSMAPQHQTPRWRLVRDLAHGGRLHLGADHADVVSQLAQLRATQLSTGALKVEGRRDDLADALALAAPIAAKLPSTGGPGGAVEFVHDGLSWDEGGLNVRGARWVRTRADGRTELAECPRWHPGFADYAQEMIAQGVRTPAIIAWEAEQAAQAQRGNVNVAIGNQG